MRPGSHYEIEIELLDGGASTAIVKSEREAALLVADALVPGAVITVACVAAGVDHGNLVLSVDAQSKVQLRHLEHRGLISKRYLTVSDAVRALEYWLPEQRLNPSLDWEEE